MMKVLSSRPDGERLYSTATRTNQERPPTEAIAIDANKTDRNNNNQNEKQQTNNRQPQAEIMEKTTKEVPYKKQGPETNVKQYQHSQQTSKATTSENKTDKQNSEKPSPRKSEKSNSKETERDYSLKVKETNVFKKPSDQDTRNTGKDSRSRDHGRESHRRERRQSSPFEDKRSRSRSRNPSTKRPINENLKSLSQYDSDDEQMETSEYKNEHTKYKKRCISSQSSKEEESSSHLGPKTKDAGGKSKIPVIGVNNCK
jgi:hypothetical protein